MYLILNLKKKWFEMWKSGEKTEDYRGMTKYWAKRLCKDYDSFCMAMFDNEKIRNPCYYCGETCRFFKPKHFDGIILRCGYPKKGDKEREIIIDVPPTICIDRGNTEWGAGKWKVYFVIKKGTII